jgi:hypothetical protein
VHFDGDDMVPEEIAGQCVDDGAGGAGDEGGGKGGLAPDGAPAKKPRSALEAGEAAAAAGQGPGWAGRVCVCVRAGMGGCATAWREPYEAH